ncbi:bifunctional [glutamine synthetase] adenylyltransferase/[glutamine synthetase]-adenylyl-L-tyrosine phosphorylase [Sneathiella sp. CAU 1612]|uniref:Bifunctional glutamine synthetase adenylyltransferase/adenylyl-removing enzyme n=1 Tax=Sneathiella sedimenti TaxID=2816034 RepID=A0ABS3F842_9PROT|nr:bifunctional [glutamine synthetase] adenylyltransferase/[glutamine synthetase]-adenylyl-L-tyrosine phosphorylase [Sneathiella sedimenti]MBO0334539.1 bifunctional [glutamine synthetase] adenylyltransferase/[glutamine synthetase]-adenylyl-L-tyrosine phosphorylase [Sneathiella sedimenti]
MQDIAEIKKIPFADVMADLPSPGDPELLAVGLQSWQEVTATDPELAAFAKQLEGTETGPQILTSVFGNSPFLSSCLLMEPHLLRHLVEDGADRTLQWIYNALQADCHLEAERDAVMAALRVAKRRIALLTALCDMGKVWELMKITGVLSTFADTAVDFCCRHLLKTASDKGELVLPHPDDPRRDSGLIIIGMGKLGARELNYSSDIDLIVLFDAAKTSYTGRRSVQDCFVKIARNLVTMMQERTRDGYVFRTDLRLRPDPGATPIALSVGAAHVYYESQGQNWERAAMIKARAIAGDLKAGREFVTFLTPFIWRKSMDFAAIEDIQAIKSQIHTHKGFSKISLEGHNIKIGRGGIREIEFFCQTQQLIEGGRNPLLREVTTLGTLSQLAAAGKIDATVREELQEAYIYLRELEHRLQMTHDEQTQLLPEDPEEFRKLGVFFGYDEAEAFRKELRTTLETVQGHYDALFAFEETPDRKAGRLVFTGAEDDPETLKSLAELGFENTSAVSQTVREWHHGRYRSTRNVRTQQILTALMPQILESLGDTSNPDAAFTRFDVFLQKLPAGVQLFTMFKAHPSLLKLLAKIMGMAPELAETLSGNPMLLDGVLDTEFMAPLPPRDFLAADLELILSTARDFQDVLDYTRRWANDRKFRLGVQILDNVDHGSGLGATVAAGPAFSDLCEVILDAMLVKVREEFATAHGVVPGGEFAVIAMGKLGSRQMTPASDADLIFVFETPEDGMMTDGKKPISAGLYYTRFCQRLINALSVHTGEGKLYEVDMRLRPHGKSGPISLPIESIRKYYEDEAWTWEHLALTRARVVAGDAALCEKTEKMLREIALTRRDSEKIRKDTLDMRTRVLKQHGSDNPLAIKHAVGGLMDLEFLCQYLRLKHGPDHPDILDPNSMDSLKVMKSEGILAPDVADRLVEILRLYLNISGLKQLCLGGRKIDETIPLALKNALAAAAEVDNFDELAKKLKSAQDDIDRLLHAHLAGKKKKE